MKSFRTRFTVLVLMLSIAAAVEVAALEAEHGYGPGTQVDLPNVPVE